jgi:hypothetical protein
MVPFRQELEMASLRKRAASHAALPLAACAAVALSLLAAPAVWAQSQAQRIAIDPATGRARAPEADELAAARANAVARSAARAGAAADDHPKPVTGVRFGAKGFRVDPSRMAFTVVRRGADGLITTQCVAGETAAEHATHAGGAGEDHDQ